MKKDFSIDMILNESVLIEGSDFKRKDIEVLCEEEKLQLGDKIITKLFNDIKKKTLNADYAIIDKTKGDINKLANIKELERAINFLNQNSQKINSRVMMEHTKTLTDSMRHLKTHKAEFQRAYTVGNDVLILIYCTMVNAVIVATSECISLGVIYTKDSLGITTPQLEKRHYNCLYVDSLKQFNQMCVNGKVKQIASTLMGKSENIAADAIIGGAKTVFMWSKVILGSVFVLLRSAKWAAYAYYHSRVKTAEHLNNVIDFINLQQENTTKKGVKERQQKWIERLQKFADKVDVDTKHVDDTARKALNSSEKETADVASDLLF